MRKYKKAASIKTKREKKKTVGRPPLYKTPEVLQAKIDDYFDKGVNGRIVIVGPSRKRKEVILKIPTITGLIRYLGFADRTSFYDMEKKEEFTYTIKSARTRIEQVYEEQLHSGTPTGAIFALKNFGWIDQPPEEGKGAGNIIIQIIRPSFDSSDPSAGIHINRASVAAPSPSR